MSIEIGCDGFFPMYDEFIRLSNGGDGVEVDDVFLSNLSAALRNHEESCPHCLLGITSIRARYARQVLPNTSAAPVVVPTSNTVAAKVAL
jgi:hypothetical protein